MRVWLAANAANILLCIESYLPPHGKYLLVDLYATRCSWVEAII
jgi:hypothetical protein